ncbi:Flavodoxin-like fold family protein [Trichomonas vaginalis G3]|uniref:Flavodoxin-like fold family protein n=1 Tax=Trichomonas vaginalis (strain ATCC PRA-98 / G3) TaxID=412133 RepID=A2D8X6_TRIV3|nr:NAD(P)H oxidoreductase-related family [Trichomonas vaginalis G3]EAY23002.1 Flavodoxin-like fold family protein [Trichomonas vaginalis G3]KAI5518964.1 NAD(P)H oxidoreductase-related family [Trichomonas vaginalis G3]|eukprot:XP_001583988.1 Flavodoxin-like fold family protein [Trichomonas vaginalis G3]
MRVFLVIAHDEPHQRSFCHAAYRKAIETLKLNKHEVMTLDLYESDFTKLPSLDDFIEANPQLTLNEHAKKGLYKEEILRCQCCIEWCTHLMLFTPMHWLSPSAALMGWWEKVFGEGWAFSDTSKGRTGFMTGKKAMVCVTLGMNQSFYGKDSVHITVEELMYNLTFRCFAQCGFTPLRTQAFFGLLNADPQTRVDMLNSWSEHVMNLESRETIEFVISEEERKRQGIDSKNNHQILAELGDLPLLIKKNPYGF